MKLIFGVHTPKDARKNYKDEQRKKVERKRREELEQALAKENQRKQFSFDCCDEFIFQHYEDVTFKDFLVDNCEKHETDKTILCENCIKEIHQVYVAYINSGEWNDQVPRILVYSEFMNVFFSILVNNSRFHIAFMKKEGENVAREEKFLRSMVSFVNRRYKAEIRAKSQEEWDMICSFDL
ncbi:MAG: hypothetical protein OXM61_07155 [Candidatus Poribacteria bacterium]|nr:hypothetical protein [Candidatus Poribacteria bacterium]